MKVLPIDKPSNESVDKYTYEELLDTAPEGVYSLEDLPRPTGYDYGSYIIKICGGEEQTVLIYYNPKYGHLEPLNNRTWKLYNFILTDRKFRVGVE